MDIPIRTTLEVIRDGRGEWDTRTVDMMLGFRGVQVEHGIATDLRELESLGLIEEVVCAIPGTGRRWKLTTAGVSWLAKVDPH